MISFVIPCYKSSLTIAGVVEEISVKMLKMNQDWEVILVNDCSPDEGETIKVINFLCQKYNNIIGIDLSKNFGQHAALMAGFHEVNGDIVVCLDDDGQTPADEVDKLILEIENGQDAVYARYKTKKHSIFRNLGSFVNNKMTCWLLEKPTDLYVSSYFAVRRYIVEEIKRYENPYPYVIGLVLRITKRINNVDIEHREREVGDSGYTFSKLIGLWLNGFTSFSIKPLRIATFTGGVFAALGFIFSIYTIIKKLLNPQVLLGWSSIICTIMVIGGLVMLMLGMIGEYIGRIYISLNKSPQYAIRDIIKKDNVL